MIIGTLTVQLLIADAGSLKDKRRVLKSLIDRLKARYNIAIAEVGSQELWRAATVGIACVSNSSRHANSILSSVIDDLKREPKVVLAEYSIEIL